MIETVVYKKSVGETSQTTHRCDRDKVIQIFSNVDFSNTNKIEGLL